MDIVSHGLWGSLAFGRKNRRNFWTAFFFGIAPDLFSFGFYIAGTWVGVFDHPDWSSGNHPAPSTIPFFVHAFYNVTHSLLAFGGVFGLVWLFRRKPFWPMATWGLHIIVDIPTHASWFFPTPFLWPISDVTVNGVPWSHPIIFFPNVILLLAFYVWFFAARRKRSRNISG